MDTQAQIETFDSITKISPENWDSVAGESVGLNYNMLLCRELSYQDSDRPRYFMVNASGTTVAVSLAVVCDASVQRALTHRLFGRLAAYIKPLAGSLDNTLICGQIPGPGAAVATRPEGDQQYWVRLICQAMEDYASSNNLHMVYVSVLPEQLELSNELRRRKYLQGVDHPVATINVSWHDQESYLRYLRTRKKSYAVTAKTEIRRFQKSGIHISRWNGHDNIDALYRLIKSHYESKITTDFYFGPELLKNFVDYLKSDCIVYIAQKAEQLVGVTVVARCKENAWLRFIGIDHAADVRNFTYFNLCYYHPLADFSSMGIQRVYYGNAVQYTKYRRGCDILATRLFVKFRHNILTSLLKPLLVLQRQVFSKKYFSFKNQKGKGSR